MSLIGLAADQVLYNKYIAVQNARNAMTMNAQSARDAMVILQADPDYIAKVSAGEVTYFADLDPWCADVVSNTPVAPTEQPA
jgi:hypothetical protein